MPFHKFKVLVGHLVAIHCMAHRLQLISEKSANYVPYIVKYMTILIKFANANYVPYIVKYMAILINFAKSLKLSPTFKQIQSKEVNGVHAQKINQMFFTRWLSFVDSV